MAHVREYTLKALPEPGAGAAPASTRNHTNPGFLFSNGGFSGNMYHDYTDVLVPLFISTHQFRERVSGMKPWWMGKFTPFFRQLTRHDVIDVDNDREVHCFPRIVVGATFHRDMGVDPRRSPGHISVVDLKRALRAAFRLKREAASRGGVPQRRHGARQTAAAHHLPVWLTLVPERAGDGARRGRRRVRGAGGGARPATDMATFVALVNSADSMVGVHGAGLTNMVFLPCGVVLVQVVPFGGLEWLTGVTFKEPASDMEVSYMDYNVRLEESSLVDQYPRGHQVLTDPYAVHRQGWDALKTAYLDKQNIQMDLDRFRATLREAMVRLPSP
jgi:hypothetical protein|uniref:Glycosyltransferase family 61 protein n=1 Tax=Zea mays TaxID=4577 RepID=A0A804UH52_MAIZE